MKKISLENGIGNEEKRCKKSNEREGERATKKSLTLSARLSHRMRK